MSTSAPNRSPMLTRRYWPAWQRAWKACWTRDRGTVQARQLREEPASADMPSPVDVERIAERLRGCSRLTADHLRHACHVRALGRDRSATQLSPSEVDRVVVLFEMLANPLSLDAVNRWLDPDIDARRRVVWRLERTDLSGEYVATVCRDRFGRPDWRGLRTSDLRSLVVTLEQRRRSRAAAANPISHA